MTHLDAEFIRDLFAQFGPVTIRRMFSGAGLFCDGLMFGLIIRDIIYLKADETSIPDFDREGSQPFHLYAQQTRWQRLAVVLAAARAAIRRSR